MKLLGSCEEVTAHRMVDRAELTTFENFRRGSWIAELKISVMSRASTSDGPSSGATQISRCATCGVSCPRCRSETERAPSCSKR